MGPRRDSNQGSDRVLQIPTRQKTIHRARRTFAQKSIGQNESEKRGT